MLDFDFDILDFIGFLVIIKTTPNFLVGQLLLFKIAGSAVLAALILYFLYRIRKHRRQLNAYT